MTGAPVGVGGAVRAALFDLDGTLVDSLPTIAEAMVEALALHGYTCATGDILPRIGPPMQVLAQEVTGASVEEAERMNADYLRVYYERYIERTPSHAGAAALLERLSSAGMRLAVVTNKVEEGGRRMVQVQGWQHHFPVIVGRETAGEAKPSPLAARYALDRLSVPPAQAAMVGDTEFDMQCGRDAGLAVVIGVGGARTAEHLRAHGATHVVASLAAVAPILLEAGAQPEAAS